MALPNLTFSLAFLKGMTPAYVKKEGPLSKIAETNGLYTHYYR